MYNVLVACSVDATVSHAAERADFEEYLGLKMSFRTTSFRKQTFCFGCDNDGS